MATEKGSEPNFLAVPRAMNRREFLRITGAGLAGSALLGAVGCGGEQSNQGGGKTYGAPAESSDWDLATAAEPLKGTTVNAAFLNRPGYEAAIKLIPQFEQETGIKVTYETMPYENSRQRQVLSFTGGGEANYDIVLIDLVWIGEFSNAEWIAPLGEFYTDPELADPELNLDSFFPVLLKGFGTWDGTIYGLPFDNYSGLLFYNTRMLEEAGFSEPPQDWQQLYEEYAPKLTGEGQSGFALQSRRGETQSADSFMRMVKAFGGNLIDPRTFEPRLTSDDSLAGLQFRQDLIEYMPSGIVQWDHNETIQGLAQGNVAMITEWSANYATLSDPSSSTIADSLGVAIEPAGSPGSTERSPAFGGFSLGINASSSEDKQKAAWLFLQWITSEAKAKEYIQAGGVSGRMGPYDDPQLQEQYPYFGPLAESWREYSDPYFRPRFAEWPELSESIAQYGSQMMLGGVSVEGGVGKIESDMQNILSAYYEGDKKKLR